MHEENQRGRIDINKLKVLGDAIYQTQKSLGTKFKACFAGIIGIEREAWRARD
ncbi:hypothetical protein HanXRQr2_Chr04g0192701 [Helianthus annuus]|uniref:Uncharacterized protein n=1 Tax=Helianthus annuus TaxID=4232 RepID=A0A9K3JCC9_HELAN|nr:hypothetical protein HanXRQr2_Chr04g0192701 [Helianthus annuus]KAJ0591391.1 hypothetical protein HanIR_Chr04g0207841 [Helianthus annuus]